MPRSENIYYYESDSGSSLNPPLVLIHGAGGNFSHWTSDLRRLPGLRILALDLPGHGQSEGLGFQTIEKYAHSMLDLLDRLGIYSAIFCGHSMGGAIAQQIAVLEPERTAGLILVSTGAALPVNKSILDYLSVNTTFHKAVQLLAKWSVNIKADDWISAKLEIQLKTNRQKVLYGDYLACDAFDLGAQISTISAPTKIIVGTADKMTIPSYSDYLHQKIMGSELSLIQDSGHMILWEKPEELTKQIQEFLFDNFGLGHK